METVAGKQTDNRTSYIDRNGIPRGNWRRIVGRRLDELNKEINHINAQPKEA